MRVSIVYRDEENSSWSNQKNKTSLNPLVYFSRLTLKGLVKDVVFVEAFNWFIFHQLKRHLCEGLRRVGKHVEGRRGRALCLWEYLLSAPERAKTSSQRHLGVAGNSPWNRKLFGRGIVIYNFLSTKIVARGVLLCTVEVLRPAALLGAVYSRADSVSNKNLIESAKGVPLSLSSASIVAKEGG